MSLDAFIDRFSGLTEEYKFYDGQVTLVYEPKSHTYFLITPDGELEPQEGVTSVCHIIDKSEALIPWACKQMAIKLLNDAPIMTLPTGERIVRQMPYQEYENLVLAGKTAHKDRLEEAGEVGHIAHAWIEQYIKAVIADNEPRKLELLAKFPADERARNCCFAALGWMKAHNVRWLGTERKIYSRRYKYAGTMDGLCLVDSCDNPRCCRTMFKDRLTVSDWKTSNYLYMEYLLQTAAYMQAYVEETGENVLDRWVIRLGKEDAEFDPWHAGEETFGQDFEGFRLALMLSRQTEAIKLRIKTKADTLRAEIKAEKKAAKEAAEEAERVRKAEKKAKQKADAEEALKKKCKKADKFKGTRKPKCNAGVACEACAEKYASEQSKPKSEKPVQTRKKKVKTLITDPTRLLAAESLPDCQTITLDKSGVI